jgi:hypothetical protein
MSLRGSFIAEAVSCTAKEIASSDKTLLAKTYKYEGEVYARKTE